MAFRLLKCLARAIVKNGAKLVCAFVPGGSALADVAADTWEDYRKEQREDALRAEVQALAQAPADQVRQEVGAAVAEEAAAAPAEVRQALTAYLSQVPAAIRRSLKRPSDPSGTTVPASLALSGPEDLLALLPPRPPRFKPGDRPLPGVDWELEELVGVGGFGEVWKAHHAYLKSSSPVALKFCLDAAAVPALRNEAGVLDRMMQHGRHPGIVPLLHTYLSADPPCLEYEFVEGGDLAALIQEMHGRGQLTPDAANALLLHLAEVVAHAHRADPPIVHGDLKPANVLLSRRASIPACPAEEGKQGCLPYDLRVTDFGIGGLAAAQAAREARQPTRSRQELLTEAVRGAYTPLYASPEQMARRRGEPADPRDDVHALGVIWYQLLTGDLGMMSVPTDWREQVEERGLGADLVKLLASCIAPKAEKRPASAVVLAERLRAALPAPRKGEPGAGQEREQQRRGVEGEGGRHDPQGLAGQLGAALRAVVGQRLAEKGHDYAAAAQELARVPEHLLRGLLGRMPKERQAGEVVTVSLGDGIDLRFAWCPPGTFLLGSPPGEEGRSDDEAQYRVTLTKGFHLGVVPVTRGLFGRFVKESGYKTDAERDGGAYCWTGKEWQKDPSKNWMTPGFAQTEDHPVVCVSWNDTVALCDWLSGLPAEKAAGRVYRLPTEAEWEYACRAGTTTPFHFGAAISTDQANYDGNYTYGQAKKGVYRQQTTPVGNFPANAWGLFDTHGNVWEWCSDWYDEEYHKQSPRKDPQGPADGDKRVLRGGSWLDEPWACRSACRGWDAPGIRSLSVGCRLVLCLD
jgi:formylglycine-generating enzyme required for sulfatase activity